MASPRLEARARLTRGRDCLGGPARLGDGILIVIAPFASGQQVLHPRDMPPATAGAATRESSALRGLDGPPTPNSQPRIINVRSPKPPSCRSHCPDVNRP